MKIKAFLMAMAMMLAAGSAVQAQTDEEIEMGYQRYPHMFIGVQGGAQSTINNKYNNWKNFTPTASIYLGGQFSPVIGARLHVNGIWDKSGVDHIFPHMEDGHYNYNYLTTNIDALVNLCTLFGRKDYYPVNLYFVGGLGVNYAWDNTEALALRDSDPAAILPFAENDKRTALNGRMGLMLDIPLHKNVSLNLEGDLNTRFAGNSEKFNTDILQFVGQVGLTFRFGYKKAVAPEEVEPVYVTVVDTTWYDDVTYQDVTRDRNIDKRIFFDIRESDVQNTQEQIVAVANFLKGVKNGEIHITAYADRETGNPELNMKYSKERAEKTRAALIEQGVESSMIKVVEWKGDTEQPYADNDKNRVSIITGHGIYTEKEKVVTKKFRTQERQVLLEN